MDTHPGTESQEAKAAHSPVVLITGAAAGIGLAVAEHLLSRSYRIIALDINEEALDTAFNSYNEEQVFRIVADLSDVDQATHATQAGIDHFGQLNALINNAGLHGKAWLKPCLEYTRDDWLRLLAVNVLAIPTLAQAALPALTKSSGVIVNMSSMVSYGHGVSTPYAVSKAAVNGLTMALSQELGQYGIRVVGLAPGFIATPSVLAALDQEALERLNSLQVLRSVGKPQNIAEIMEFLISRQSSLITGTTIRADLGTIRYP